MGLIISCPNHSSENLNLAFAKVQGLTIKNEDCYLFPCGTLVILDEECNVKEITIDDIKKDIYKQNLY